MKKPLAFILLLAAAAIILILSVTCYCPLSTDAKTPGPTQPVLNHPATMVGGIKGAGGKEAAGTDGSELKIVGYITQYSIIDRGDLPNVNLEQLTHLIWQSVEVTSADNSTLQVQDGYPWSQISDCVNVGHANGIKVLASLWGSGDKTDLDTIVSSNETRATLINNLVDLVNTYNLDGIEVDWESDPGQALYDQLLMDLHDALNPLGKIVVTVGYWSHFNISLTAASYVDFINVMTYDMWDPNPYPYNSLYEDTVRVMNMWADAGYPKSKILLGIPFFGRDADDAWIHYGDIVDVLSPTPDQNEASISIFQVPGQTIQTIQGGVLWWNGIDLAKQKVDFVEANGFGGVFVYEVGTDKLNDPHSSLLANIYDEMSLSPPPPTNNPPEAVNDDYSTNEDTTLNVAAPGVLSNDSDPDGDSLTAVKVSNPSHGTLNLNSNGSFTYAPATNYNGSDSFTYRADDGQADSNAASVNITIIAVNDAPVVVNDAYSTNEDTTLKVAAPGVLSNDSDPDGDSLTAVMVSNPSHGTLTLNSNGSFTHTPATNYNGSDSFTYRANDGQADSSTATVTITIKATPSPPSGGGGGGGGGGATEDKRFTTLRQVIGQDGTVWENIEALSLDGKLSLIIPMRTVARNKVGAFLNSISVTTKEEPYPSGEYQEIIDFAYELGPSGATFDPPVSLSIKYDASKIPQGILEKNLMLAYWDSSSSNWVDLESTVDPIAHTVSTKISHLSTYAVMAHTQPAIFEVSDLTITPPEIDYGKSLDISATITNNGDLTGSYKVSLKIDNAMVQTKQVNLACADSATITFNVTPDTSGEHNVNVNGLSGIFTVKELSTTPIPIPVPTSHVALEPARFAISDLSVTPREVMPGKQVIILAVVTNTGGSEGSYTTTLKINGAEEAQKEVTIGVGKSEAVTFEITEDKEGDYTVNIGDRFGQFAVIVPTPTEATTPFQPTINWWLIGDIILACAVVGLFTWKLISHVRKD